jgi:predicted transcriptional regulator
MSPRTAPNVKAAAVAFLLCFIAAVPVGLTGADTNLRGSLPPIAVISSPQNNSVFEPNQSISFSGNGSNDGQDGYVTSYLWNFGDNSSNGYYMQTAHLYTGEGLFEVYLTVFDNDNMTDSASVFVNIHRNRPPVAFISAPQNYSQYYINDTVQFGSVGSSDPEQGVLTYLWEFGDGANSTSSSPSHRYLSAGNLTVKLTVTDPKGLTASASLMVMVKKHNSAPIAIIASPGNGASFLINETINFSAAGSYDPDQDVITFTWDFGDGEQENGRDVTHSYAAQWNRSVTVIVKDALGLTGSSSIMLRILKPNTPPVAMIGSPKSGTVFLTNESITFSANGSYDADGDNLQFHWSFGDGQTGSGWTVVHIYSTPGNYSISLNITDGKASALSTCGLIIKRPNQVPVARVPIFNGTGADGLIYVNSSVRFMDNSSYDPDGDSLYYSWEFGDGAFANGSSADHIYATPGSYVVKMKVTDPFGARANASVDINVKRWPATPTAVITVVGDNAQLYVNDTLSLTGTNSTDPWGYQLTFRWKMGNSTIGLTTALNYRFLSAGSFDISLEVSNGEYANIATRRFTVLSPPEAKIVVPSGQPGLRLSNGIYNLESGREMTLNAPDISGSYGISWDFGDGTTASGGSSSHSFAKPGDYKITINVTEGASGRLLGTSSMQVHVNAKSVPAPATNYVPFWMLGIMLVVVIGFAGFLGGTEIGLYMLFPLLSLLYSKIQQDQVLDNYTRGQIHGYIVANPGDHYNSIRSALKLNNGTLAYHLKRLESENIVKSRPDGVYRRFYPVEMRVPEGDTSGLTDVQRVIIDKIRETPGISQKDIAGLLNVSAATVNYHMETLQDRKFVRRERAGMRVRYYVLDGAPTLRQGAAK